MTGKRRGFWQRQIPPGALRGWLRHPEGKASFLSRPEVLQIPFVLVRQSWTILFAGQRRNWSTEYVDEACGKKTSANLSALHDTLDHVDPLGETNSIDASTSNALCIVHEVVQVLKENNNNPNPTRGGGGAHCVHFLK